MVLNQEQNNNNVKNNNLNIMNIMLYSKGHKTWIQSALSHFKNLR